MSLSYAAWSIAEQMLSGLFGIGGVALAKSILPKLEEWDRSTGGQVLPHEYWLIKEAGVRIEEWIQSLFVTSPTDIDYNYIFIPKNKIDINNYKYIFPSNNCNPGGYNIMDNKNPNNNKRPLTDKEMNPGSRMGFALDLVDSLKTIRFHLIPEGEEG